MQNSMSFLKSLRFLSLLFLFLAHSAGANVIELTHFIPEGKYQASFNYQRNRKERVVNKLSEEQRGQNVHAEIGVAPIKDLNLFFSSDYLLYRKVSETQQDGSTLHKGQDGFGNSELGAIYRFMEHDPFVVDAFISGSFPFARKERGYLSANGSVEGNNYSDSIITFGSDLGGMIYELEWIAKVALAYHYASKENILEQQLTVEGDKTMDVLVGLTMQYNWSASLSFLWALDLAVVPDVKRRGVNQEYIETVEGYTRTTFRGVLKYAFSKKTYLELGLNYSTSSEYKFESSVETSTIEKEDDLDYTLGLSYEF